jgi:hypothetical protein
MNHGQKKALDESAVDEMAVDDLTPHQLASNRHLNLESNIYFFSKFVSWSPFNYNNPIVSKNLFLKEEMEKNFGRFHSIRY